MLLLELSFLIFFNNFLASNQRKFGIIGGKSVAIRKFPHQCAYLSFNELRCSASIISEKHAISAGHCAFFFGYNVTLRCGSTFHNDGGEISDVEKIFIHPLYDPMSYDYDFSILVLKQPLNLSGLIKPAKLVAADESFPVSTSCIVSGWGLDETSNIPDNLQSTKVQIVNWKNCSKNYGTLDVNLTKRMLCAASLGRDSCSGDSGGPLNCNGLLVGVVSFGNGCGLIEYPGIYAALSTVRSWIFNITGV